LPEQEVKQEVVREAIQETFETETTNKFSPYIIPAEIIAPAPTAILEHMEIIKSQSILPEVVPALEIDKISRSAIQTADSFEEEMVVRDRPVDELIHHVTPKDDSIAVSPKPATHLDVTEESTGKN
jgi:hypothetical protein